MSDRVRLGVTVNGTAHAAEVEPRLLLSDFLRQDLGLTGTHVGCEHGVCGACTVLVDGEPVRACLMFAVQADGATVATVEGLAPPGDGALHPLQAAFREAHALQCGFCTPGILMSMVAFLRDHPAAERARHPRGARRTSLPLHRLRQHRRGRRASLMTPSVGSRVVRNEDARLLTGRALFVDDVQLPGMLHVAFRAQRSRARPAAVGGRHGRAPAAGRDRRLHGRRPRRLLAARTAAGAAAARLPGMVFHACTQVPLAKDKVRYVGEPLAMVVAESRYLAEDALADIVVDIEPLPAVVDLEAALAADAPRLHEHLSSNLAAHVHQRKGDYAAARAGADVVIQRRFHYDRGAAAAIENRAVAASWNAQSEELTIWDTTQAPIPIRNGLARMLGLAESQVRVIAPFVGGGFGPKIMMFYPEEVLVPWAARALGRPVKWTEDRLENFVATTQERGQVHDAEMALTRDGRILGVKDVFLHDTGAYDPYGLTVPINSPVHAARCLPRAGLRQRVHAPCSRTSPS